MDKVWFYFYFIDITFILLNIEIPNINVAEISNLNIWKKLFISIFKHKGPQMLFT